MFKRALNADYADDVEVNLHAGVVEGADHLLELTGGPAPALVGGVAAVGGEERQGHVAYSIDILS